MDWKQFLQGLKKISDKNLRVKVQTKFSIFQEKLYREGQIFHDTIPYYPKYDPQKIEKAEA